MMIRDYVRLALENGADPNEIYAPEQYLPELVAGYQCYVHKNGDVYGYEFEVGECTVCVESEALIKGD